MSPPRPSGRAARLARTLGVCAAAALLAAGCAVPTALGRALGSASAPASDHVDFGPCPPAPTGAPPDPATQCGLLTVPVDYTHPDGATLTLAVSRRPADDPARRLGVLVVAPGGTTGSGLAAPTALAARPELRERYDLVGVDPRGTGRSTPVGCGMPFAMPADLPHLFPRPTGDGDIAGNVAYARAAAAACAGVPLTRYLTSANIARDLDRVRAALGTPTLSYLGDYDGAYAGAVYASMFPEHTGRVVLDGTPGPAGDWRATFRAWGPAVETRMTDLTTWVAARDDRYHLGTTAAAVRARYLGLAEALDRHPMTGPSGVVTGPMFREITRRGLYADSTFPATAGLWAGALAATAATASSPPAHSPSTPDARPIDAPRSAPAAPVGPRDAAWGPFPEVPADNLPASLFGLVCGDSAWPSDPAVYANDVRADQAAYPVAGGVAANIWPCAFWPADPAQRAGPITPARSDVLVVQAARDPATPEPDGDAMRTALGPRARMLHAERGGHVLTFGMGGTVDRCVDDATTRFLTDERPAGGDVDCPDPDR